MPGEHLDETSPADRLEVVLRYTKYQPPELEGQWVRPFGKKQRDYIIALRDNVREKIQTCRDGGEEQEEYKPEKFSVPNVWYHYHLSSVTTSPPEDPGRFVTRVKFRSYDEMARDLPVRLHTMDPHNLSNIYKHLVPIAMDIDWKKIETRTWEGTDGVDPVASFWTITWPNVGSEIREIEVLWNRIKERILNDSKESISRRITSVVYFGPGPLVGEDHKWNVDNHKRLRLIRYLTAQLRGHPGNGEPQLKIREPVHIQSDTDRIIYKSMTVPGQPGEDIDLFSEIDNETLVVSMSPYELNVRQILADLDPPNRPAGILCDIVDMEDTKYDDMNGNDANSRRVQAFFENYNDCNLPGGNDCLLSGLALYVPKVA